MESDIKKIADHYGICGQLQITMEECAELIQACSKVMRKGDRRNLIEEIADVEIMIYQLKYLFECFDEVDELKKKKIRRQLERISKEV
ncbi:MAG: hypothetical protein ACI4NM_01770 [Bullifex sp.]